MPDAPIGKPVRFHPSARNALSAMPADVKDELGQALWDVQQGERAPLTKLTDVRPATYEAASDHIGNTYRMFITMAFPPYVYVLDAFQKKSTSGRNIPRVDMERIKNRLSWAEADYATLTKSQPEKRGA